MTDDEALLNGIIMQNDKYKKLLAFVAEISEIENSLCDEYQEKARELLKEIGESDE